MEHIPDQGTICCAPDQSLAIDQEELGAVLWRLLEAQGNIHTITDKPPDKAVEKRVNALCQQLSPHLKLTSDDRLLLRLRFIDGYSMKKISEMMKLDGDPYKRLHKIIHGLRIAFQQADISGY